MFALAAPDFWTIVNAIAGTLSAAAALIAVIVAARAFNQARLDRKADAKSHRPKFHPVIVRIVREVDGVWSLESYFQNQSSNSAINVSAEVCIYDSQFRRREFCFESKPSEEIHHLNSVSLDQRRFVFEHPNDEYYFVYRLMFTDANTGDEYEESFFEAGKPPTDDTDTMETHLEIVSRDIKYRIEQGIKQFAPVDNSSRQIQ